ncbi:MULTISPECIES: DUF3221 domain-containing protein [Clostridia]|uniref:DUF3221 domain-containing protein n=1 Tax=Clostridia TaxID=186801 RepID=UPI000EA2393B|nr:DUF3221 domain-containing protein [Clostridium sp. 1xD42-85]NBJ68264.1 DUF3221 domain-containing protein [Roseburia sp. 1XD42-34]RKI82027.1 DUF3221 domain-containing protein [Clostridium sp. 1xD42-85]
MVRLDIYRPSFKKVILVFSLVVILTLFIHECSTQTRITLPAEDIPTNHTTVDGYIASIRLNKILISDEPIRLKERLSGYITSDYGPGTIIISKHEEIDNKNIFAGLKVNQKVNVYGDYLRESNPARIYAYSIEVLPDE